MVFFTARCPSGVFHQHTEGTRHMPSVPREITKKYGVYFSYWGSDETFPVTDWQEDVSNDDTRLGYWDWVAEKMQG